MDNSEYKVCEVCGQEKHISEFSKSYPRRCKACVAEHTKMVRERAKQEQNRSKNTENRAEMQKVVVKDTGETVMVRPCREPLNARKEIDWEQRRYEIAKEAVRGVALNTDRFTRIEIATTVNNALELADLLISELKKGGQNV